MKFNLSNIVDRFMRMTSRLSVDSIIADTQRSIERLEKTHDALRARGNKHYNKANIYVGRGDADHENAQRAQRVARRFREIVS